MQNLPLILHPGKIKNGILMVISLGFVVLGVRLLDKNIWIAILNIFFFGICFIVYLINFIPNASYLQLGQKGIEMKTMFKTTFIPWQAVKSFDTKNMIVFKMVTFEIDEKYAQDTKLRSKKGGFPDTYGMTAKKLAIMLNELKSQVTHS